jgi:hypothetical protein
MDQSAKRELLLVVFLLAILLVFGILATAIFVRQYRREKRKR